MATVAAQAGDDCRLMGRAINRSPNGKAWAPVREFRRRANDSVDHSRHRRDAPFSLKNAVDLPSARSKVMRSTHRRSFISSITQNDRAALRVGPLESGFVARNALSTTDLICGQIPRPGWRRDTVRTTLERTADPMQPLATFLRGDSGPGSAWSVRSARSPLAGNAVTVRR